MEYPSQLAYGKYGARICTPVASVVASRFVIAHHHELASCFRFPSIERLFSASRINEIMIASHRLYEERFSAMDSNLMLLDIQHFFPTCVYSIEVAGVLHDSREERQLFMNYSVSRGGSLTHLFLDLFDWNARAKGNSHHHSENAADVLMGKGSLQVIDKKLVLIPLNELIAFLFDSIRFPGSSSLASQRISLLVTSNAHTVCYLFDSARTSKDSRDSIYLFDSLKASLTNITPHHGAGGEEGTANIQQAYLEKTDYSGLVIYHEKDHDFFSSLLHI